MHVCMSPQVSYLTKLGAQSTAAVRGRPDVAKTKNIELFSQPCNRARLIDGLIDWLIDWLID